MGEIPIPTIVFALIAALIVFGFFSIFFRNSREEDITFPITPRASSSGLDAGLLETLPTFLYSQVKHLKIGKGALECAVCLNEFEDDNETLRLLPICDHAFHRECIDEWLSSHTTCPVCRANLAKPDMNEQQPPRPASVASESGRDEISVTIKVEIADDDDRPRSRSIKSTKWSKFPRSHSTGHSLVQPYENLDRFTLKLPDQIRKEIMSRALKTTSVLPGETSSRSGYRESYRRLGSLDRPDRWMFSMAPPFLARESPVRKSNRSTGGSEGSGSNNNKRFNLIGRLSFNRFGNSKRGEPGLIASN